MKLKKGYILYLLIFSSIVSIAWIGFNVYQASIRSTISEKVNAEISSISPNFSQEIINRIEKREHVTALYQNGGEANQSSATSSTQLLPIPSPTIPAASQSGSVSSGGAQIFR